MRFNLKYVWKTFIALLVIGAFFGVWSLPQNWKSATNVLTAADKWIIGHAAYPGLFFVGLGLLIGTVLIPDAWGLLRDHLFPPKIRPDVDGATVFKEVLKKSKRAKTLMRTGQLTIPLRYESHLTSFEINEGRLKVQIVDEFHDFLRSGEITAWGTPDNRKPHQEIKPEEWSEIEIDFDDRDMNSEFPHGERYCIGLVIGAGTASDIFAINEISDLPKRTCRYPINLQGLGKLRH